MAYYTAERKESLTKHIGDEDPVKFGFLQGLRQLNPVLDVIEAPRFVLWVAPQTRGLVATACVRVWRQP